MTDYERKIERQEKGANAMKLTRIIAGAAIVGLLVGCAKREVILPGERLDLRSPLVEVAGQDDGATVAATTAEVVNRAVPINLPATVNHSEWTHRNGTPEHKITHPALAKNLTHIWSASIGAGESRKYRITADPEIGRAHV